MTTNCVSRKPFLRRCGRAAVALSVASLSLVAIAGPTLAGAGAATRPATPANEAGPRAQLRAILKAHLAQGEFVGARISLLDADGTISEARAGTTTVDRSSGPVDFELAWNIGSATKTFVAVVVLQLAEEGAIDLDAGIDAFMADLPDADRITPRQLLQHTSGLNEYINQPAVTDDAERPWTPAELIAVAETAGRVAEPGQAHAYSNANFIVLGEIIEKVTGHRWSDEVRTRIAGPLGLTHTREMTDVRPVGYKFVDDALVDSTFTMHPSVGGAAGALLSTNRDLLVFTQALRGGTLLSSVSLAAMQAFVPAEDYSAYGIDHGYGLGLERYATGDITVLGHMGTGEAQSAFIGWDEASGSVVAVSTNVAVSGPQALMALEALTALSASRPPT